MGPESRKVRKSSSRADQLFPTTSILCQHSKSEHLVFTQVLDFGKLHKY